MALKINNGNIITVVHFFKERLHLFEKQYKQYHVNILHFTM